MPDIATRILEALGRSSYSPIKPKVLAKRLTVPEQDYPAFRQALRVLIHEGRIRVGPGSTLIAEDPHGIVFGTYKRTNAGPGYVRLDGKPGEPMLADVAIREGRELDAASGDRVQVKLLRPAGRMANASGEIVRVLERATRTFVGTYFERDGEGYVQVDGIVFAHSISVGDPGAKGARAQDKVQIDLLSFPTAEDRGEGVITEVFGPLSQPGVDLITVIRAFGLPEAFPEAALNEARSQADTFTETLDGREDFTGDLVITIDPVDARDFDDAVSVELDPKSGHTILTVHIADVAHFVPPGGPLDVEARKRATSVYLPQKVIPMFPEVISNGLASLQQGKLRYVKTVQIEFDAKGQKAHVRFANGAIRARRRFSYEEVSAILKGDGELPAPDIVAMLSRLRELALRLKAKRQLRGSLELSMPEAVLDYDADGRMSGAHFAVHDISHQMIEECMLAANEAVAEHFSRLQIPFLRRVHPSPNPEKLQEFASFAGFLGYPMARSQDRFELQRVLLDSADKPERAAIHFSLLRSLKQAKYSPEQDQHYALASLFYCHFTSPIRRYPDLQVHRLLDRWIRTGRASADQKELVILGDHCSKMERRAETAERELVKLKLLQHLSTRIGTKLTAVITGVAEYGFFAQAEEFPAEGLIHVSSMHDDHYTYDETSRSLSGGRTKQRYRLGDRVVVEVARVELQKRMLDLRVVGKPPEAERPVEKRKPLRKKIEPVPDRKKKKKRK